MYMTLNLAMQLNGEIGHAFLHFSDDKKLKKLKEKLINLYIDGYRFVLRLGLEAKSDLLETYESFDGREFRYSDEWFSKNSIDKENISRYIAQLYFRDIKEKYYKEENIEAAAQYSEYERIAREGGDEEYKKLLPILPKLICPKMDILIVKKGFNIIVNMETNYFQFQDQLDKIISELNP